MSEWISVKDRFPKIEEKVLTYSGKYFGVSTNYRSKHYDGWANYDAQETITHWMPLPEPPKDETNE